MKHLNIILTLLVYGAVIALASQAQTQPDIISFTYDGVPLIYDEVEGGVAMAVFSWRAENLRAEDSMQIHAVVDNTWVLIGENFDPVKSDTLVIAHPLSFIEPLYRLSIVDSNDNIVDEARLSLTYRDDDPDGEAIIEAFSIDETIVSRSELINGTARLPVSWQISNRTANTNIIIEQVEPMSGVWSSIELPRDDTWMRSQDTGTIAPFDVNDSNIGIRMRLVDIVTRETLKIREQSIAVIEDMGVITPTQSPTAIPDPYANILLLVPDHVNIGETIPINWTVPDGVDADEVVIREWHEVSFIGKFADQPVYFETEGAVPVREWTGLSFSGELLVEASTDFYTVTIPGREGQGAVVFALYLYSDGELLRPQSYAQEGVYLEPVNP